jgi:hypothetical protein
VKRVRGKNILWLSVIAMLLSVMMVNIGTAPAVKTELYITPDRIPEQPGTLGHIGDEYYMSVNIEGVTDLYGVGFTIQFAPFGLTLTASDVSEGPFMSEGGSIPTAMAYKISVMDGTIKVGISRLGNYPGASGSGTVCTFKFTVSEAGSSPITIKDVGLVDSNLNPMDYVTFGSSFYGCTADVVRANMPDGRHIFVGQEATFNIKVRNDGDVPIYAMGRLEVERDNDGRRITLYAGQTYYGGYLGADPPMTEVFCDGYYEYIEEGWNHYGASPWLNAIDGDIINSTTSGSFSSMYTFADIAFPYLGIYDVVTNVDFYGYTRQSDTAGDIDPYAFTVSGGTSYDWCWTDSMGGTTQWAWTGLRYYKNVYNFPEYYGFPLTHEGVNNAEIGFEYFGGSGPVFEIDAVKMRVEFATIVPTYEELEPVCILPGEEAELPAIVWVGASDHVGKYMATCYLEYSEKYPDVGFHWKNTGDKVATFHFWVEEP